MSSEHTLILLRHGKSDWSAGTDDFSRPLNKRGEKSVPKMGQWLRNHGPLPQRIISSPAERAWRTAGLVAGVLELNEPDIVRETRLYAAGLPELKTVIDSFCSDVTCSMIVGHNPGLDELLMHLSAAPPARDETGKLMTTAALAILDYNGPVSSRAGSASLHRLIRPRDIK